MPILNHRRGKKIEPPWSYGWYIATPYLENPDNCVSYFDVITVAEAYSRFYDKILPTTVLDGDITHILDKSDLTKDTQGNTVALDGSEGDVCVSIPTMYIGTVDNDKEIQYFVSNKEFEGSVTPHLYDDEVRKYIHLGMFQMPSTPFTIGGKSTRACSVYSESVKPWVNCAYDTVLAEVDARGSNYHMMSYLSWVLYQMMYMYTTSSLNSQTAVAMDNTASSFTNSVGKVNMLTCKGKDGRKAGSSLVAPMTSAMYLFLANPWGNVDVMLGGFKLMNNKYNVCTDMKYSRGIKLADPIPSSGWTALDIDVPMGTLSGYTTQMCNTTLAPFLSASYDNNGSKTTYYCDTQDISHYNESAIAGINVGGMWSDTDSGYGAGIFNYSISADNATMFGGRGSRIMIFDNEGV